MNLPLVLLLLGVAPAQVPSVLEQAETERKALFKAVADGVVFVNCGGQQFGSGFFLDKDGLIATNLHVVDCQDRVDVVLRSGEKRRAALVLKDASYDLALLRVRPNDLKILPLELADSDGVEVGDYAAAVSHPVGGVWSFTEGHVSNRYPAQHDQYAGLIQTQVPVQPGSSGGPLLNRHGKVVGVVTAKLKTGDTTAFCLQSNLLRRLWEESRVRTSSQLAVQGAVPGVEVFVDGKAAGTLPAMVTIAAGAHSVELRRGGRVVVRTVEAKAGGVVQLHVVEKDFQ